jgi:hypothetical protein
VEVHCIHRFGRRGGGGRTVLEEDPRKHLLADCRAGGLLLPSGRRLASPRLLLL